MNTRSRKQREIQEREEQILEVSRPLLRQEGYHGLSMDRIADALQYSKGTIYNHFPCKEEIILALTIQTTERRTAMFQRAASFRGRSRERMQAIGMAAELFVQLYPDHFMLEQLMQSTSVWDKTTEKRRNSMRACELRCISTVAGVVRDAVANDDLSLPDDFEPEDLVFGLWSFSFGALSIIASSDRLQELGIREPIHAFRQNVHKMLDGFGWQPLSDDYDIEATSERLENEVFSDELQSLEV